MNEVTKECIKRNIKYYEDGLKETEHQITRTTEVLANFTEEKDELLEKIKLLKEDLGQETTEI